MTATTSTDPTATTTARGRRVRHRALGLAGAVVAACLARGVGVLVGADYRIADSTGEGRIDLVTTAVVTVVLALLGWALLAGLERFARHGRTIWTTVAALVTVASLVPVFLVDATGPTRIGLVLVHLAVGAVLIPAYVRAAR